MPELPTTIMKSRVQQIIHLCPTTATDRGRPVFKLIYDNPDKPGQHNSYVVKAEFTQKVKTESADFAFGLTRSVARGTRARALDPAETAILWDLLASDKTDPNGKAYAQEMQRGGPSDRKLFTWVMMGFKDGLTALDKVTAKDATNGFNIQRIVAVLSSLKETENLERLGAMLATDLFLGNEDRFRIRQRQQGIQNYGNIFFVEKGAGMFKLKALDPWDAGKQSAIMDQMIAHPSTFAPKFRHQEQWTGLSLLKESEMLRIATNACDSLNDELTQPLKAVGYTDKVLKTMRLDGDDVKKVVEAMKQTRTKIREYCNTRKSGRGGAVFGEGLKSRMELLDWA